MPGHREYGGLNGALVDDGRIQNVILHCEGFLVSEGDLRLLPVSRPTLDCQPAWVSWRLGRVLPACGRSAGWKSSARPGPAAPLAMPCRPWSDVEVGVVGEPVEGVRSERVGEVRDQDRAVRAGRLSDGLRSFGGPGDEDGARPGTPARWFGPGFCCPSDVHSASFGSWSQSGLRTLSTRRGSCRSRRAMLTGSLRRTRSRASRIERTERTRR
jgi:hypothetical protein